ncbi:MAG: RecQ family ATP-dependent DNA helicase [Candidatus Amulumruptor caecigallinarius]|nr:RecQ family ATP-dependent DNA helicase [Candidatus Amulumruptor caecigallinarius]MCM1396524.1 RecQ family ATP-dependent DNA helicase [Candidatus Amulumruptor caecigallinarius]MCM1453418.1 RecQ family ATP-dependent DNA helicase [bacterium]
MMTPRDTLRAVWGYDSFRPMQEEIIASILSGNDTLGLLPTGGGKSLTFQVPALILPGLTIVITPLISLMKDQVDNLKRVGVPAGYLYSGMTRRESTLITDRCAAGRLKLLYISPERLRSRSFLALLRHLDVSLIVVDEAHCISQWGYDFRPSYLGIASLRELFPQVPVLALTASATPEVADDIMAQLRFRGRSVFARSFSRDNLSYIVRHTRHKEEKLLQVLRSTSGSAIVYVRSRKRTRELAARLMSEGISADCYHAGLDPQDKADRQNRWKDSQTRVMVATNAFGMGIDKPDVRVVVHLDLPSSLEEYYQEAGRAGRDGLPAFAVLITGPRDKAVLSRRLADSFPPRDYIRRVYELALNFVGVAIGEGYDRTFPFDFDRFVITFKLQPAPAASALGILTRSGWIEYCDEPAASSRVMILAQRNALYDTRIPADAERLLQSLMRCYTGLFSDYVPVSETVLRRHSGLSSEAVYDSLLLLSREHIIHYIPRRTLPYLYLPTSRELPKHVLIPLEVYDRRREALQRRLQAMKAFAFDDSRCRVAAMLAYFGENSPADCGSCDVCRAAKPRRASNADTDDIERRVTYLASQPGGHSPQYILAQLLPAQRTAAIEAIRRLTDREQLRFLPDGTLTLP